MTKSKTTKKALLSSAFALLLCFTMLLGTTFAWFTDSASIGINTIQAGNLDIEVLYAYPSDVVDGKIPDTAWKVVDEETPVFNPNAFWEPGYTEVVYFKYVNKGTLSLQFKMLVDIIKETPGTNIDGDSFNLSDYIEAYVCGAADYQFELYETRDEALNPPYAPDVYHGKLSEVASLPVAVPEDKSTWLSLDTWNWLEPKEEYYTTLVLFMPTTVGNEANNKTDTVVPSIDLGINFVATQYNWEKEVDSYDKDYDANAEYPEVKTYDYYVESLEGLKDAFANGGNILLTDDIEIDNMMKIPEGVEVYLDMNGQTITFDRDDSFTPGNPLFYPLTGSKFTITGNGTVDLGDNYDAALVFPAGDVVIENGSFIRNPVPEGTDADNVRPLFVGVKKVNGQTIAWESTNVTINGGYFDSGYYDKNAADIEDILAGTKTLAETADDIAKRGNSKDANIVRVALKNNIQLLLNSSYNGFTVYGGTFVGANPAWGDEGAMLPAAPDYLRPWSYYQRGFLEGQTFNENGIVLPEGYSITTGTTEDGRPTYTVNYSK